MLYQILSLATRKDILGEAISAETLNEKLYPLIDQHGAIIVSAVVEKDEHAVKTKAGMILYYSSTPDCDENAGGYYVEVYTDPNLDYRLDYFCVHPDDCDCKNLEVVNDYIKKYIEEKY